MRKYNQVVSFNGKVDIPETVAKIPVSDCGF